MCAFEFATGKKNRGALAVATSSILLVVLATSAGVALKVADRAQFVSADFSNKTQEFIYAEAALEEAMAALDATDDWGTLTLPAQPFTGPRTLGKAIIWSEVYNDTRDKGGIHDTNGLVTIKAYSQRQNSVAATGIETLYWRPYFIMPPVAGVIICGEDILDAGPNATRIDGYNHFLPPAGCTGSHCNSVRNGVAPDVAGIAFELTGAEARAAFPKDLDGVPPWISGQCPLGGEDGVCTRMRMISSNFSRIVGVETITEWPAGSKESYGTVNDPKLLRVAKGTELKLTGNSQGAGVFFVEGTVTQTGTFTFSGLIIVGQGGYWDQRGTANIFGSVITAGLPSKKATLQLRGNGSINWASDAVQVGPFNIPALTRSWREIKAEKIKVDNGHD